MLYNPENSVERERRFVLMRNTANHSMIEKWPSWAVFSMKLQPACWQIQKQWSRHSAERHFDSGSDRAGRNDCH